MKQLVVGLMTEGTTDARFLRSVAVRTFRDILLNECDQYVELYLHVIAFDKNRLSFAEQVMSASRIGVEQFGIMALAVHTDADRETIEQRIRDKIVPAQSALNAVKDGSCCQLLTPIIPVRMIEAWMLADKLLLKQEIGTEMSDHDLGIDRDPESIANPKSVIEEAIVRATSHLPKRRHRISIADLYGYLGDAVELSKLATLPSFIHFQQEIRKTLRSLNYINKSTL